MKKRITYKITDRGLRVGEDHQHAKLTDAQVDHIRTLYEEGFVGYRVLVRFCAEEWGVVVTRNTIKAICSYHRRVATPERYKTVYIDEVNAVRVGRDLSRGHGVCVRGGE